MAPLSKECLVRHSTNSIWSFLFTSEVSRKYSESLKNVIETLKYANEPLFQSRTLSEVSRESGVHDKFAGAIQRILINGKSLQLLSGEHINVVPYKSHICSKDDACLNGGICVPYLSTFYCKCLVNFSGTHCQNYSVTGELSGKVNYLRS